MTGNKSDEIKEAKREYHREWRRKNPERVAKIQERFWRKKAAEIRRAEQEIAADPERSSDK